MSEIMADQFQMKIVWSSLRPLVAGRSYLLCYGKERLLFNVTAIKFLKDEKTGSQLSAKKIDNGNVGVVNISLAKPIQFCDGVKEKYDVLDLKNHQVVGEGFLDFPLYRATNIRWQQLSIDKNARANQKSQIPKCIWFTGLSGSGKSTIANLLERKLFDRGLHTYLLDGDNLRHGLNRDLGFTEADRAENIRRVAEVAKLMVDAGLIVIASFISPYQSERQMARLLFADGEFVEIFVDTPIEECEKRDVKGLYAKARRGDLKNFTGIDSAYERPEYPELILDTCVFSAEECVEKVFDFLSH